MSSLPHPDLVAPILAQAVRGLDDRDGARAVAAPPCSLGHAMVNDNVVKIGICAPNCSGGMVVIRVPERWDASWMYNLELARMADDAGVEFLLPIACWTGYGGETDFQGL